MEPQIFVKDQASAVVWAAGQVFAALQKLFIC